MKPGIEYLHRVDIAQIRGRRVDTDGMGMVEARAFVRQGVEVVATHARPKKYVALVDDAGLDDAMPHQASFGFTGALKARLDAIEAGIGKSEQPGVGLRMHVCGP